LWHAPARALLLIGTIVGGVLLALLGYNVSDGSPLGFALAFLAVLGYAGVMAAIDWFIFN
jgi:drug/metabolite transporter (DMT)-like permease